jgi:Na+/H+ antiporter
MSFFESLVALLFAAIILLQLSRRLSVPYPALLAMAGVLLALIPGAPSIELDPETALALFIAPVLIDAAFDFPISAVRRLWRPLIALAIIAVLLTAGVVTWLGVAVVGLPLYAALALGAIVAPPDAAAATAVLNTVSMPRRSVAILKGESLLNDALALMLFGAATSVHSSAGTETELALRLAVAVPGGVVLGIALAWLSMRITPFVTGTLGGNLMEFAMAFAVWILAERLSLSPILCIVAFAMTVARTAGLRQSPRVRVHSFAVWTSVVFLLNVLAFLLMGMQVRGILADISTDRLRLAGEFAALVVAAVVGVRLVWVLAYNWLARIIPLLRGDYEPATTAQSILVGWCGMRGLVTLATSLALPADFPQRDLIVLTAFAVILATLVFQGMTLVPLVRLLKLDSDDGPAKELSRARVMLANAALAALEQQSGKDAEHLRYGYERMREAAKASRDHGLDSKRSLGLAAIESQRKRLEELRSQDLIGPETYLLLQEELDFRQVSITADDERRIEEN